MYMDEFEIDRRNKELDLELVLDCPETIKYIKEPSPEVCMAAIEQNGSLLRYIEEQSPELCMAAVRQYPHAIAFAKDQSEALCIEALRSDPEVFVGIRDEFKTEAVCLEAVKQDPNWIRMINEPTQEMYKIAEDYYRPGFGCGM